MVPLKSNLPVPNGRKQSNDAQTPSTAPNQIPGALDVMISSDYMTSIREFMWAIL